MEKGTETTGITSILFPVRLKDALHNTKHIKYLSMQFARKVHGAVAFFTAFAPQEMPHPPPLQTLLCHNLQQFNEPNRCETHE
jgi:hypothetical protein